MAVQIIGRRLETDAQGTINALIVVKNALLDNLCLLNATTAVQSAHTFLSTQNIATTDSRTEIQLMSPIDNSVVSIPIDRLLRVNKEYNAQVTSVCLQVTFMQSPVPKYAFKS